LGNGEQARRPHEKAQGYSESNNVGSGAGSAGGVERPKFAVLWYSSITRVSRSAFLRAFVPADPFDPRETQRVAARVAVARLDLVARDLQHDPRRHRVHPAELSTVMLRNNSVSCAISSSVTPLYALPTFTSVAPYRRGSRSPYGER
jgi:hypothetical protein